MWCVCGQLRGVTLERNSTGLYVEDGATATMDGGSISGCRLYGVVCEDSGSTATVRPPAAAPSAAPPCPLRAAGAAAFLGPVSPFFPAVFWRVGTAVMQGSHRKRSRQTNDIEPKKPNLFGNRPSTGVRLSVVRVWAAARGHPRAEQEGLPHVRRRQDRGGRRGVEGVSEGRGGDLRKCNAHRAWLVHHKRARRHSRTTVGHTHGPAPCR